MVPRGYFVDIKQQAQGHWLHILPSLGVAEETLTRRGTWCPTCNAGTDRFMFDDLEGRGTYHCRHCGAGDGFALLMGMHGWDFARTAEEVRRVLGITERNPLPKPPPKPPPPSKPATSDYARQILEAANDSNPFDPREGDPALHPYMLRKGLHGAFGAARGKATGKLIGRDADCLIVPSRAPDGELQGVECISADGKKQSFGSKGELVLGNDLDPRLPCLVFEGFASAAAWLQSLNSNAMAVVSFGKGRQMKVAEDIERRYPKHVVIVAEEVD